MGDDWEDILAIIIMKWSSNSYILKEHPIRKEEEFHCQFAAQMGSLGRRIYKEYGVTMEELYCLDTALYCDGAPCWKDKSAPESELV